MEDATAEEVGFPCDNCGARMKWNPDVDALHCEHCGHEVQVPRDEGTILEHPLADAASVARGFGLELRVAQCDTCGARVTFDESETANTCVYCGSSSVLPQEANRNAIRPESLVPLDVGRADVEKSFRRWIKGLWFRPNDLKKTRRFEAVGIYVPFWTFDCRVHSDWSADAGHYYWVTETYRTTVNGKRVTRRRRKRKIRWEPAWGARQDAYDDMLINASRGQPADLVRKLGQFDTGQLVGYRPEYLAGWRAEEYQVDLESGWGAAQQHVESTQHRRCAGDVPGDTHRNLRVRNTITDPRWKHILLPIWSLQYRFKQKTYTVLVHGQSGHVVGDAPYSWAKIALLVVPLAIIALVVLLVLVAL
ncbi:MAG: TFIIB-type zinc ribbon-containing protein [Planctomycetota bacterium]